MDIGHAIRHTILSPAFLETVAQSSIDGVLVLAQGTYVYCWGEHGQVTTKIVTPSAVRVAFTQEPLDSGFLPSSVVRTGTSAAGDFCVAFYPPARHPIPLLTETGTQLVTVPLPGMVLVGIGQTYSLWSVRCATFSPTATVYAAPLPNVYHNGQVCWGRNIPPLAHPTTMDAAWELVLTTPFTRELAAHKCVSAPQDVRNVLATLARRHARTFPQRELVTAGPSITVADLVDCILKKEEPTR